MLSLVLLSLVAASQLSQTEAQGCGRVVCYHTNWSQYRPGSGKFFPENIDPHLCTHLVYAFAKLSGNSLAAFEWNDDSTDWSVGLFDKFINLKRMNPSLKMLLAVGGWNLGSEPFHQIAVSPSNRQAFITQAIQFLRQRHFDGLDLDWEYPANRGSPPEDKQNFIHLIREMKAAFEAEAAQTGKEKLLLTAAVAAGKPNIDTAYDIPVLSEVMDYVSLMSYDLHGSWETYTGHNSALYARSDETGDDRNLNLDWAANYWVSKGMDKSKFNIGMGLYGRSFTLASASNYRLGDQAPRAGQAGQFTREAGFNSYYEICDMIKAGAQVEYDSEGRVPYLHQGTNWVGYDNPASLREKVRYVKAHQYGGVMVWALPLDDFSGQHCGEGPFPLMHAIADECQHNTGTLATSPPAQHTQPPVQTQGPGHHTVATTAHAIHQTHSFTCPDQDGFYASSSCYEYYICVGHVSYSVQCLRPLVFNPESGSCDMPDRYHCTLGDAETVHPTNAPVHTTQAPVYVTNSPGHTTHAPVHVTNEPVYTTHAPVHTNAPNTGGHVDLLHFCEGQEDGLYPDPASCVRYLQCSNGYTYVYTCGAGTAFSFSRGACDPEQNVPDCRPSEQTADVEHFCAHHQDGIFADPTNCAYFIECSNGLTYREPCAPSTAWNDEIKTCDRMEAAHCDHTAR